MIKKLKRTYIPHICDIFDEKVRCNATKKMPC